MPAAPDRALNGRPRSDSDVPALLFPHCAVMVSVSPTTLSTTDSVQRDAVLRDVYSYRFNEALVVKPAQTSQTARISRLGPEGATGWMQFPCRMTPAGC